MNYTSTYILEASINDVIDSIYSLIPYSDAIEVSQSSI